jgi:hypothetical protein
MTRIRSCLHIIGVIFKEKIPYSPYIILHIVNIIIQRVRKTIGFIDEENPITTSEDDVIRILVHDPSIRHHVLCL